jgi:hypothetical protein
MHQDIFRRGVEQGTHLALCQPDGIALDIQPHLNRLTGFLKNHHQIRLHIFHDVFVTPQSELTAEGLVQQRLFQRGERGELLLVNGFEALGLFAEIFEHGDDGSLHGY